MGLPYVRLLFAILFLFSILPGSQSIGATDPQSSLKLSRFVTLKWKKQAKTEANFLPGQGGFFFKGSLHDQPFTAWISRSVPLSLAVSSTVNKFWSKNLKEVEKRSPSSSNSGCKKLGSITFECERYAREDGGKHVFERLLWHSNTDLVLIRVTSSHSDEHLRSAVNLFAFEIKQGS